MTESIKIALSKGRILEESLPLLARAGIEPVENPLTSRKLIIDTNIPGTRDRHHPRRRRADLCAVRRRRPRHRRARRAHGRRRPRPVRIARPQDRALPADGGRAGQAGGAGRPKIVDAGARGHKYVNITRRHFAAKGIQTDIIKLYGSMELAPLVGLSDRIVDLVETGNTLKANGLVEIEQLADISAWLVGNQASMKMKHATLKPLVERFRQAVGG